MPAEIKVQAYQDHAYKGRLRDIFPSADRAKSIVEVRVSILDADAQVKPEMSASVTFQEPHTARGSSARAAEAPAAAPVVLVPKRAVVEQNGQTSVWIVAGGTASRRPVVLGKERLDLVEARSGVTAGETVVVNPPPTLTDHVRVRVK
jgi:hypothetical protein